MERGRVGLLPYQLLSIFFSLEIISAPFEALILLCASVVKQECFALFSEEAESFI